MRIAFPAARAYELSERDGPLEPPSHAHGWPEIALLDGSVERGDIAAIETPRGRLYVLNGLAEGWAASGRRPADGAGARLGRLLVRAQLGLARESRVARAVARTG